MKPTIHDKIWVLMEAVANLSKKVTRLEKQLEDHGHAPFSKTHAGFGSARMKKEKDKDDE